MTKENSIARRLGVDMERHLDELERYLIILKPVDHVIFRELKENNYLSQVAIATEELLDSPKSKFFPKDANEERYKYILKELYNITNELDEKLINYFQEDFNSDDLNSNKQRISFQSIKDKYHNFLDKITGGYYTRS